MGVRFIDKTHSSTKRCPPKIAKTAENNAEPTNSQHTIEVVLAVKNTASLMRSRFRVPALHAIKKAPAAPTAADSVAVVMPNKITPNTTNVRIANGMTEVMSMDKISYCSASNPL